MATVADLVAEVRTIVDVDDTSALRSLNRRHRQMVTRSKSLRGVVEISTVSGTAYYAVSGVVEVDGITVNGVPYGRARRDDIYAAQQGALRWHGPGGFIVVDASIDTVPASMGLTLIPTPTTTAQIISLYAVLFPDDFLTSTNLTALNVDVDMHDALVHGAAATFLRRQGEGDVNGFEADFLSATEELRQRVQRRFRGAGPPMIRVQGVNA